MPYPSHDLHGPARSSRAVRDLFQSLFVAELIHPSPKLWLFFAWISQMLRSSTIPRANSQHCSRTGPLLRSACRNCCALFSARGVQIRLVIREDCHNDFFIARLQTLKERYGDQIKWSVQRSFTLRVARRQTFQRIDELTLTVFRSTANILCCAPTRRRSPNNHRTRSVGRRMT